MKTLSALSICLLMALPACSAAELAGARQTAQEAADTALRASVFGVCYAATVGAVRREYGTSEERMRSYVEFCQEPATLSLPVSE